MENQRESSPSVWTRFISRFRRPVVQVQPTELPSFNFNVSVGPPIPSVDMSGTTRVLLEQLHTETQRRPLMEESSVHREIRLVESNTNPISEERHNTEAAPNLEDDASRREELFTFWQNLESTEDNKLAVPERSLNHSKFEPYTDLTIPARFICPITRQIITNPFVDPRHPHQAYERLAITAWLKVKMENPLTRERLTVDHLVVHESLQQQIDGYVADTLRTRRTPSLR